MIKKLRAIGLLCTLIFSVPLISGFVSAQTAPMMVVALGASNTLGKGVALKDAYPAQLESMLQAKGLKVGVVNAGVDHDTTEGMANRLEAVMPLGTRVVILQPNKNDADAVKQQMIAKMKAYLTPRNIRFILLDNAMTEAIPPQMHQADGVHLTPEGYRLLASRLLPQVLNAMQP